MPCNEAKVGNASNNAHGQAPISPGNNGAQDIDADLQADVARLDISKVDQLATTITERLSGGLEGDFRITGGAPVRSHRQGQMQEMFQLRQSVDDLMTAVTAVKKSHANRNKEDSEKKLARPTDTLLRAVMAEQENINKQLRDIRILHERFQEDCSCLSRSHEKQVADIAAQVQKLKKSCGKSTGSQQDPGKASVSDMHKQLDALSYRLDQLSLAQQQDREITSRKIDLQASVHLSQLEKLVTDNLLEMEKLTDRVTTLERERIQPRHESREAQSIVDCVISRLEWSRAELASSPAIGNWEFNALAPVPEDSCWSSAAADEAAAHHDTWTTTFAYDCDGWTTLPVGDDGRVSKLGDSGLKREHLKMSHSRHGPWETDHVANGGTALECSSQTQLAEDWTYNALSLQADDVAWKPEPMTNPAALTYSRMKAGAPEFCFLTREDLNGQGW